ncbi:MAG TPA: ATP-binding protein [Longimicrobiales bacterium]
MSPRPEQSPHPLLAPGAADLLARELRITLALLSREREETEGLMDAITEGILQLGPGGVVVRANHAARAFLGLSAEPEGRPLDELVRDAEVRACLQDPGPGVAAVPREVEVGGRRLLVRSRTLPERLGVGTVVILLDLTELQRFEGLRRDFVASASHELKTPLTSIRGYAELLLEQDPPAEVRRAFLEKIERNARRLEALVEDLLDLSRLDAGGWRPRLETVDVRDPAIESWASFAEQADRKRLRVSLPSRPALVRADHTGLVRVFSNLFSNAVRHTPANGRIAVRVQRAAGGRQPRAQRPAPPAVHSPAERRWTVIDVRDTGVGIPSEALPRIFERFYRVDPARARGDGGAGLGLAIVKHLVERMDGDVSATSEVGEGTVIRIRLPAAPDP